MLARPPRPRAAPAAALALLAPSLLGLLATTCSSAPPPPVVAPPPPGVDSARSNWELPAVPLVHPRTVILLQPRPGGPDASALEPIAPDPTPLVASRQWVYDLRYDKGDVYLVGVHASDLPAPRATPRVMGRFAFELYTGPVLTERVRFDFPGLGAYEEPVPDGGRRPLHGATVSWNSKLTTHVGVMLPAVDRGTKLVLWDRATNRRWPLPWPAVEMTTEPPIADATSGAEGAVVTR